MNGKETFKFTDSDIGPKKKSFDLFGDGTITMVWVPGHSKGLASTIIKTKTVISIFYSLQM